MSVLPKNQKILIFSGVSLLVFSLIIGFAVYLFFFQKSKPAAGPGALPKEETLAEKQLKELEELRNQAGIVPLTQEQIRTQQKELESLRKKSGVKPLTQSQIQKQLDELESLRQGR